MQARIPWIQKTSRVEAEDSRAGLSTSTPLSLAAASTSSSSTTREVNPDGHEGGGDVLTRDVEESSSDLVLELGHRFVGYLNFRF